MKYEYKFPSIECFYKCCLSGMTMYQHQPPSPAKTTTFYFFWELGIFFVSICVWYFLPGNFEAHIPTIHRSRKWIAKSYCILEDSRTYLRNMKVGNTSNSWAVIEIDGSVQERRKSSALAMELRLSCTNPSKCETQSNWKIKNPFY